MKQRCSVLIATLLVLSGCATLSPARSSTALPGATAVSEVRMDSDKTTETEYVDVVRYVYPEQGIVTDAPVDQTELVPDAARKNTVTVSNKSDFYNSIVEYDFIDGRIYEIFTAPDHVTDIRLQPSETISGDTATGDANRWLFSASVSLENGQQVQHLFIKPLSAGLETSLIIPTSMRTYYLLLKSFEALYMTGVRWRYPGSLSPVGSSSVSQTSYALTDPASITFAYMVSGNSKFPWYPTGAYDDGIRTYIQFDPRFLTSSGAPSLYLVRQKTSNPDKFEVVNYRTKGNLYIVDFVLQDPQQFLLLSGDEKVFIRRDP